MSETKHTPGPWRVIQGDGDREFDIAWSIETGDLNGVFIGQISPLAEESVGGAETAGANARLIAAAPELLAALEYAHRFGSHGTIDFSDEPEHVGMSVSFFVERALAKAKGTP